jgi:hypothetical protein
MPEERYQLEFRSSGNELQVAVRGNQRNADNTLACWLRIAGEVRLRNPRRLLVVSDVEGEPMQPEDMRALFGKLSGRGMEGVRVAYVDLQSFKTPRMETAEILASEHGFSVRIFDNRIAAEMWLRHGED